MTPKHEKADPLAKKILLHSRKRITGTAPFLLECIYALRDQATDSAEALFTDGKTLYYDPLQVITDFRRERNSIAQQLLHVTAHCLLGHLPQRSAFSGSTALFDAVADMKAAQFAILACGDDLAYRKQIKAQFPGSYRYRYATLPHLPSLYETLRNTTTTYRGQAEKYRTLAAAAHFDSHDTWDFPSQSLTLYAEASANADGPNWEKLLSELASHQLGALPGTLPDFLRQHLSIEEPAQSYSDFLRRFAAPQERMLIDPDTFDPRWYHLGLRCYGNIPLLEEAEISEPPVPDDLVIALDTSGSCSGEICRQFLHETLGILRDIAASTPRFRVTLMQCDTRVHQTDFLESAQQVEDLFHDFTAIGFGGTDFCPVFERIEELRADGTLPRVRGLLYLSDACGTFPEEHPDYPTVFLIPEESRWEYSCIPDWITRLYFNHNNFTVKEADTA